MDINEEENNNKKDKKTLEKRKTSGIFKKEILILMDLYNFNNDLKNNINKLTISKEDSTSKNNYIYLIREDYFSNFTEIFLYKLVHETIKNGQIDPKKSKVALLNSLSKIYQEIYLDNINNYKGIVSLDNENIYKIEYTLNNTKTEMVFIYQYAILNQDIIDIIYKDKSKKINSKFSHIINSKKIIIKYDPKKSILIGTISEDDIKNIFIPEIILEYNDITQMKNQFNFFEKNEYEKLNLNLEQKIDELKDEENNIIGKIYLIDKNKYNNLSKYNENILLGLYNNYEIIKKKMQNPFEKEENSEKYYIIDNNYIKKLKELFKYEDILPKLNNKIPFKEIIIQENYILDRNIIMNELSKDELFKIKKAELKIDENNIINYFTEFDIISKELKEYLEEYNLIQINQELIEIELIPGNNKIIIHSFNPNKNIAIILSQNDKNEFISELIFVFDDSIKLKNYLNKIIEKGFDTILQELNFTNKKSQILDDKKEECGNAYEIISLIKKEEIKIKEEILNMIQLYLFNKDINNKIKNDINKEKYEECKGYLINKEFIDKYKEYYLYNDIKKYLDNLDNVNNTEENIKIIYEKMKQEEFFKNYINKDVLLLKDINIEQIKINKKEISLNEKKYFYFDEFTIVTEDIYKKIINENIILNNDKIEYIINSGKIFLFITSEDINQVLIGEIKNDTIYFCINSLIVFNSDNELNEFKSSLMKMDFSILTKYLLKNKDNKLFTKDKKEIGIVLNIDKNSDFFNNIEEENEIQKKEEKEKEEDKKKEELIKEEEIKEKEGGEKQENEEKGNQIKETKEEKVKEGNVKKENDEKERQEKERQEKERQEKERQEKERLEKERLEKERLEKERLEKERQEKEKQEKEKLEKEKLEKEKLEKEKLEKEKLEKEKLEKKEKLRKEKEEKEKQEKEKQEKEKKEKEENDKKLKEEKEKQEKEKLISMKYQWIIELYINIEKIKRQIKESKFNKEESYYIMNNGWFKYLKESYNYDSIIKKLIEEENIKKYLEDSIKSENFVFKKDILGIILSKENNNNNDNSTEINKDIQINLAIKNNIQKLKIENNEKLFLDKFTIINDKIKNILKAKFKIESEIEFFTPMKCLRNKNFTYIFYSLNNSYLINIGNFNEKDFMYETTILLEIDKKEYFEELLNEDIINKEITNFIDNLIKENISNKKIEDINKNLKGIAYLIKKKENNNIKLDNSNKKAQYTRSLSKFLMESSTNNDKVNKETFPSKKLEKDIKILIKYILFKNNYQQAVNCSKSPSFYKLFSNCYLINVSIWYKYRSYFFYGKLKNIIEEKTKIIKPINNKSTNLDEALINEIYTSLIKYFITNKDKYDEKQVNAIIASLEKPNYSFEVMSDTHDFDGINILYPNNFEIVDEYVFNDLKNRGNLMSDKNYLKCDFIINEEKIIIKSDRMKNDTSNCSSILIGNFDDITFDLKYLIKFSEEKNRKEFFGKFLKESYKTIMGKYQSLYISNVLNVYNDTKIRFISYNDSVMNFDENHINDKIIKIFLFIYLSQDEFNQPLKKCISENGNRFYYIINKQWMKIYKDFYEYKKLLGRFDEMKKNKSFDYYHRQLIECMKKKDIKNAGIFISNLIKNVPEELMKKLEEKKSNQNDLINNLKQISLNKSVIKLGSGNNIAYFTENEIITIELFDLINQLETLNISKSLKNNSEKIECLIGENKMFIKCQTKYSQSLLYYLNIGYIQNNIFTPSLLIYYYEKEDFEKFISYLNNKLFSEFIQDYNLINNASCNINNSQNQTIGKICRIALYDELKKIIEISNIINPEAMKILKLIIYLKKFEKEKDCLFQNSMERKGYFVKVEFIYQIQNLKIYKIIEDYIIKTNVILDIINNNSNKNIESLSKIIESKFTPKKIKEINTIKENININISSYNVSLNKVQIDKNNYVQCANNFIILDEEIYNLFKVKSIMGMGGNNYSSSYILGENKIFVLNDPQKSILEYRIKDKNELDLELILHYDKDKYLILNQIREKTFTEFRNYFLFAKDCVSPIFDQNQNKIGMAYKYPPPSKNNYSDYEIKFEIRKTLVLYLNYKKYNTQNNKGFNQYYMVNKSWIENYKKYYEFDSIYKEIDKIPIINNIIDSIKENEETNNKFITDKKLTLIFKNLPKNILDKITEKENNFNKVYKNTEAKVPNFLGLNYIDEEQQQHDFFYFDNFEIINSKIYKYLFENIDTSINFEKTFYIFKKGIKNEEETVLCLFDKNRIIIKLLNNPNSDNKSVLYIGKINSSFTFEIECFLIYDKAYLMNEHIEKINNSIGFNDFCEEFMNTEINIKELEIDKIKYGIAVKKNQNPDWDFKYDDNDLISKYFKFAPKIGLANIGATCYMNATLQCFCQIEKFASYFKYHSHVKEVSKKYENKSEDCLTTSFKILIDEIWPQKAMKVDSNNRFYEPHDFRKKIAKMNILFQNVEANDAKDLVNFIIMTLHEELNEPIQYNNNLIINNQEDPNEVFNVFNQDYSHNFRSKISDLFYAIQKTKTQCITCGRNQFNFQAYFFLVFPLEEVKKYTINNINLPQNNNNPMMNNMNNNMNNFYGMNGNMMNMNNMNNITTINSMNNMNSMNNFINMNMMNNNMMNNNMMNNNMMNLMNTMPNMNFMGMNNNFNMNNMMMNQINSMNQMNPMNMMNQMNQMNPMNMMNQMNMMMNQANNINMMNMNLPSSNMNNYGIINIFPNNVMNNTVNQNMNNNPKLQKLNNNIVDIMDCFEYNQKQDLFQGNDQIYCNKCNGMSNAYYTSYLETAPKVLILLLNRGVGIQFKIKLEFTTELDITKYVNQKNGNIKYKLVGVITHLGESGSGGHFIAHCLSPIDHQWYTYNDAIVSKIDDFQKQIIDLGMPYLLFYTIIDETKQNNNGQK